MTGHPTNFLPSFSAALLNHARQPFPGQLGRQTICMQIPPPPPPPGLISMQMHHLRLEESQLKESVFPCCRARCRARARLSSVSTEAATSPSPSRPPPPPPSCKQHTLHPPTLSDWILMRRRCGALGNRYLSPRKSIACVCATERNCTDCSNVQRSATTTP